jgi:hypothetical protein
VSGWMINIELPVADVQDLLQSMPNNGLTAVRDGFALAFCAPDVVAYGSDAAPDRGTDITVKGSPIEESSWQLYRFLEAGTSEDVTLWMVNDGSQLEAARGTTAEELGL